MNKTALITGISGQDGSYLAEHLLVLGYRIFGLVRDASPQRLERIGHLLDRVELLTGDLTDAASIIAAVEESRPDEIYNLAGTSTVRAAWEDPPAAAAVDTLGIIGLLEAVRTVRPRARFLQAASSEIFGEGDGTPAGESSPFRPINPLGVAKLYGHLAAANYRDSYGMFCVSAILFDHMSPRCGADRLARRITRAAADISRREAGRLVVDDLRAARDWGWTPDCVQAMHLMLQADRPADFVIATGETHTVEEFCSLAFGAVGLDHRAFVDEAAGRPPGAGGDPPAGNAGAARAALAWKPTVPFAEMVRRMVEAEPVPKRNEP